MNYDVEATKKRMREIREKNDVFLAAKIPGYDPEKVNTARAKLVELIQKNRDKNES